MADTVLSALVKRRAEVLGEMDIMQGRIQQAHADLASLDSVIHQIDPEYPLGTIRPKYRRAQTTAEQGSLSRAVLDNLRRAGQPLSSVELAKRIMAERGLHAGDRALTRAMGKRVGMALRYQRTNGMVREAGQDGSRVLWEVS